MSLVIFVSPQPDVLKEWKTAIDFQSIESEHVAPKTTWIEPELEDEFLNILHCLLFAEL